MMPMPPPHWPREDHDVLEVWLPLLFLGALGGTWYHVLRLRERAIVHARDLCQRHGLQLLDDSISLHRLRARWRNRTLHVTREYRFDTSLGGNDRQTAGLTLAGDRIVGVSLPSGEPSAAESPAATVSYALQPWVRSADSSGNVVPLDRRRRTLH